MTTISEEADLQTLLEQAPGSPVIWKQFLSGLNKQFNTDSAALFISHFSSSKTENHLLYSDQIAGRHLNGSQHSLLIPDAFSQLLSQNHYHVHFNPSESFLTSIKQANVSRPRNPNPYQVGLSLPCHDQFSLCLTLSRNKAFQKSEQFMISSILNRLTPHLERAVRQEQRLKIKHQLFHLLNQSFDAFLVIDRDFNILFSDPIDQTILSKMACLEINLQSLEIKNPVLQKKLTGILQNAEEIQSFKTPCYFYKIIGVPIQRLDNLYHWECFNEGFILVFIHNKNQNDNIDRLKKIYRLSNSEAICALHFIETPSISIIAENTFRSQETVRNHLKHIMQKMAVHTQAELMKKLISLSIL